MLAVIEYRQVVQYQSSNVTLVKNLSEEESAEN